MTGRQKLIWKIFPAFLLITLGSLVAVAWYASQAMQSFYKDVITAELESRARIMGSHLGEAFTERDWARVDRLCKELGELSATRLTVVDTRGRVLGDSHESPSAMDNHRDRPELRDALSGQLGIERRFSDTLQKNMLYVAVPLRDNGNTAGAVRAARALTTVENALQSVHLRIGTAGFVVALAAIVVSLMVTQRIVQPLRDIQAGAERFANGELGLRLPAFDTAELDSLARTMNLMAEQLSSRIRMVNRQRGEAEAILSSMVEGVLAVDTDENVIRINAAASQMLDIEGQNVIGRNVRAIARYPGLQNLLTLTLKGTEPVSGEVTFHNRNERFVRIHGAQLLNDRRQQIGAVLVLNDLTQLRQLENLRRDFVANVSHEIRTPITSIQGFVETLLEGAAEDAENRERFLNIILKQTHRLNALVEDLLMLSRLESAAEKPQRSLEQHEMRSALLAAVQVCESKAQKKEITVEVDCPADLEAYINPLLFEQAIINLIDNAVNYSSPQSSVQVRVHATDDEIAISVQDFGCGIPAEHLPRLFERFYRVDKARSRQVGGTGLGLAIVKHVAQEHGGRVDAISRVGEGSTFTIFVPRV